MAASTVNGSGQELVRKECSRKAYDLKGYLLDAFSAVLCGTGNRDLSDYL